MALLLGKSSAGHIKETLVWDDKGGQKGIPKSIIMESKELVRVNHRSRQTAYKENL